MSKRNAVFLAPSMLLGAVGCKGWFIVNYCLRTVYNGVVQMGRPVLYHFVGAFRNTGLKMVRFPIQQRAA